MEFISYYSSGRLGDFIYQLSVIHENFLTTGKKGILYISDAAEPFAHGARRAYEDTKTYISALPYIAEYKLHQGEHYDVNLSSWRSSPLLFKAHWNTIFNQVYNVEWGKNPWLFSTKDARFEDKILIHCSTLRWPGRVDFHKLFEGVDMNNVLFITQNKAEHTHFCNATGLSLNLYIPNTLDEFICAVNSCVRFIGNLSSPSTYAYGLHKPCITLLLPGNPDNAHVLGLESVIPTITFLVEN
jgi:hypothetical protein